MVLFILHLVSIYAVSNLFQSSYKMHVLFLPNSYFINRTCSQYSLVWFSSRVFLKLSLTFNWTKVLIIYFFSSFVHPFMQVVFDHDGGLQIFVHFILYLICLNVVYTCTVLNALPFITI